MRVIIARRIRAAAVVMRTALSLLRKLDIAMDATAGCRGAVRDKSFAGFLMLIHFCEQAQASLISGQCCDTAPQLLTVW